MAKTTTTQANPAQDAKPARMTLTQRVDAMQAQVDALLEASKLQSEHVKQLAQVLFPLAKAHAEAKAAPATQAKLAKGKQLADAVAQADASADTQATQAPAGKGQLITKKPAKAKRNELRAKKNAPTSSRYVCETCGGWAVTSDTFVGKHVGKGHTVYQLRADGEPADADAD